MIRIADPKIQPFRPMAGISMIVQVQHVTAQICSLAAKLVNIKIYGTDER